MLPMNFIAVTIIRNMIFYCYYFDNSPINVLNSSAKNILKIYEAFFLIVCLFIFAKLNADMNLRKEQNHGLSKKIIRL